MAPSLSPQGTALLATLEAARDLLARRLVRDCHGITDPDLNSAIVSSLLRSLFLRTGQECGFVDPATLAALAACHGIAGRMARACSDAGLRPGAFLEPVHHDRHAARDLPDEPLREILTIMNGPEVPVPVARLPLEELARVFEHFVGTRMESAEGHRVKRVGKSSLLYTGAVDVPPQTVIDAVVSAAAKEVPGNAASDNRPAPGILDPACGAGLFLLAALRSLSRGSSPDCTGQERAGDGPRNIICSSLFGTDIDPESVSAARFVLLLAFIEETGHSGSGPLSPGQTAGTCECLTRNIRCGNALIASDYFSGKPVFPFNADERQKVNAFDWHEAFPGVLKAGGFDAVIGSPPPYRPFALREREEYFQTHYTTYAPSAGLYGYFIERGLLLLRPGGSLAFLVPGTFLRSRHGRPLRRHLLSRQIERIAGTGITRSLQGGEAPVYILSLRNQPPDRPFVVSQGPAGTGLPDTTRRFTLDQRTLDDGGWNLEDTRAADLMKKILRAGTPLDDYLLGLIEGGVHPIRKNPLVVDLKTRNQLTKGAWWCRRFFVPLLRPSDIRRYMPARPVKFIILLKDSRDLRKCRAVSRYLESVAKQTDVNAGPEEETESSGIPSGIFSGTRGHEQQIPKIVFSPFQQRPAFSFDPLGSSAIADSLLMIPRNDPFLAAVLNSTLGRFILAHTSPQTARGFHVSHGLGKFPVMTPDFEKPADTIRHEKIVSLVARLLSLQEQSQKARTDQERRLVQQEIDATDVRIDALVYEMYGLTPEEIVVVGEKSR
jgi:hypothetical protein